MGVLSLFCAAAAWANNPEGVAGSLGDADQKLIQTSVVSSAAGLADLPPEMYEAILQHMSTEDALVASARLAMTCKALSEKVPTIQGNPGFFKRRLKKEFSEELYFADGSVVEMTEKDSQPSLENLQAVRMTLAPFSLKIDYSPIPKSYDCSRDTLHMHLSMSHGDDQKIKWPNLHAEKMAEVLAESGAFHALTKNNQVKKVTIGENFCGCCSGKKDITDLKTHQEKSVLKVAEVLLQKINSAAGSDAKQHPLTEVCLISQLNLNKVLAQQGFVTQVLSSNPKTLNVLLAHDAGSFQKFYDILTDARQLTPDEQFFQDTVAQSDLKKIRCYGNDKVTLGQGELDQLRQLKEKCLAEDVVVAGGKKEKKGLPQNWLQLASRMTSDTPVPSFYIHKIPGAGKNGEAAWGTWLLKQFQEHYNSFEVAAGQ